MMEETVYYENNSGTLKVTNTTVTTGNGSYPMRDIKNVRLICLLPVDYVNKVKNISIALLPLAFLGAPIGFVGLLYWYFGFSVIRLHTGGVYDNVNPSIVRKSDSHNEQLKFMDAISKSLEDRTRLKDSNLK